MKYDYADSKTGANAKHFGRTLFILITMVGLEMVGAVAGIV